MSAEEFAQPELERAEAALAKLDVVERDWDAIAGAVDAKLADVVKGSTANALLEPPLPLEPGEEEVAPTSKIAPATEPAAALPAAEAVAEPTPEPALVATAEAPVQSTAAEQPEPAAAQAAKPQSLADMARASVSKSSAREEAASLAKETLAVAGRRGPSAEVVERVQAAAARSAANRVAEAVPEEAPRTSGVVPRAAAASKRKPSQGAIYGAGLAVIGIAAAAAIFVRGRSEADSAAVSMDEPAARQVELAAPAATPQPAAPAATPLAAPPTTAEPEPAAGALDLPQPQVVAKPTSGGPAAPAAKKAAAGAPAPPALSGGPAPEKIVLEEDAPPAGAAPAPPSAPSVKEPPMRPADNTGGSIPQKPSIGAVQAAMGSVMGAARSCIAGQKEASSAQVVFSSDGAVQSVSVAGAAAGTPAAGCIEGALRKARIQPFAVPTFSTAVTIRPP